MSGIKDQKAIDDMRRRLYARSQNSEMSERHDLKGGSEFSKNSLSDNWASPDQNANTGQNTSDFRKAAIEDASYAEVATPAPEQRNDMVKPVKKAYRLIVTGTSLFLFVLAVVISSAYLYFGSNQISARNISLAVEGPFAIPGGDVLPLQVGITNENSVRIESATLIVNYPDGARSVGENSRELFEERLSLGQIEPGETKNIPLTSAIFGEENEEKEINLTIEYRVRGSNGTFYKDADPFVFKINSASLVLRVESVEKVASGQEVNVKVTLQSNSNTPLENILLNASYPNTFSYLESFPEPTFSENSWTIDRIEPGESATVLIEGLVSGLNNEAFEIKFVAGHPSLDNSFVMGSILAQSQADYFIERPFLDVVAEVNGDSDGEVELEEMSRANVRIEVENTLPETIYNLEVKATLNGNSIGLESIKSSGGFYDASDQTITWAVSGDDSFARVLPGTSRSVSFSILPDRLLATDSYSIDVEIFARRINESAADEELVGTDSVTVKYYSNVLVGSEAAYGTGPFLDTGPVPPVAGETTTYTLSLAATAGVNDANDVVVSTALPQHVRWMNEISGEGDIIFNTVSNQLRWNIGDIPAGETKTISFRVSFLPSVLQIDKTPILMGNQELQAVDSFTGVTVRSKGPAVTTELSSEAGFPEDNGVVQEP